MMQGAGCNSEDNSERAALADAGLINFAYQDGGQNEKWSYKGYNQPYRKTDVRLAETSR
jgi:hypothetical protein